MLVLENSKKSVLKIQKIYVKNFNLKIQKKSVLKIEKICVKNSKNLC